MSKHEKVILNDREVYLVPDIMNAWISNKRSVVSYYEHLHDPEHSMNHGNTVAGKLSIVQDHLDQALIDSQDQMQYIKAGNRQLLSPKGHELDLALADIIRSSLRMADDFRYNKYIVIKRYRDAITAFNLMKRHTPGQYDHVNCKFFLTNLK